MDTWPIESQRIVWIASGIQRVSAACTRRADKVLLETCGFTHSQFKLLWMLYRHEAGMPQNVIANWLNQTEAGVSRQVGILIKQGLVSRSADPDDKRTHIITLTSDGREFTETATASLVEAYAPDFAALSPEEQEQFILLLEKLFSRMCGYKK